MADYDIVLRGGKVVDGTGNPLWSHFDANSGVNVLAVDAAGRLVVVGFSNTFYLTQVNTFIQQHVPNELRGRVMGAYAFGTQGMRVINGPALGTAAQLLGLAKRMVDLAVDYSFERKQFGKPVGSFQAVKHLMANVAVQIEFAKGPLYRAAYAVARGLPEQDVQVSHARLACSGANSFQ